MTAPRPTGHPRQRASARLRFLLVGAAMVALIGTSVGAAEPITEPETGPIVPFTFEGRSLASWAAESMARLDRRSADDPTCQPDAVADVVMLVGRSEGCTVTDEQSLFIPIVAISCEEDARLSERAARAKGKRRDRLVRALNGQEALLFRCLHGEMGRDLLREPFLSVDGVAIAIDEHAFVVAERPGDDGRTGRWAGYFAMLAPQSVGTHTIVTGHGAFPDDPLRVSVTIEVIAADAA